MSKTDLAANALAKDPEVLPLALLLRALSERQSSRTSAGEGDTVLIPPPPAGIRLGHDKVRVFRKGGVRIIQVDNAARISGRDLALVTVLVGALGAVEFEGGITAALEKLGLGGLKPAWIGTQKNAIGVAYHNYLPGGGADPLNYL